MLKSSSHFKAWLSSRTYTMRNYPLGIHEQTSSGTFGALFFCVLAKGLRLCASGKRGGLSC